MRDPHTASHAPARSGSTIAHAALSTAHTRDSLTRALSKWPAVRVATPPGGHPPIAESRDTHLTPTVRKYPSDSESSSARFFSPLVGRVSAGRAASSRPPVPSRPVVEAWSLVCERCGRDFVQRRGPGRPRQFCLVCSPPGRFRRRPYRPVGPRTIGCVECGEPFVAATLKAMVCSRRCKDARYRREHREAYAAKQARKYRRRRARDKGGAA
jgi:hypothetical protein